MPNDLSGSIMQDECIRIGYGHALHIPDTKTSGINSCMERRFWWFGVLYMCWSIIMRHHKCRLFDDISVYCTIRGGF